MKLIRYPANSASSTWQRRWVAALGLFHLLSAAMLCLGMAARAAEPIHVAVSAEQATQPSAPIRYRVVPYALHSGPLSNQADDSAVAFRQLIKEPGAPGLRLHFSDYQLGEASFITVTALADGERQLLDAQILAAWQGWTAFFNGDAVEVTVNLPPGESGISFRIDSMTVGGLVDPPEEQEICGTEDDRVPSNHPALGRITAGCTGWLISNGAGLTAGHCAGSGQMLQFNVPPSLSDGTVVNPPIADQYPITYFASAAGGLGNDWAVFAIGPNSNGQTVVQRQGAFFRMSRDLAPTTLREFGYGIDGPPPLFGDGPKNADSQTQQTHEGPFVSETITSPSVVVIRFRIDDENGSSGAPVIDTSNGSTIGVATNAGCTDTGGSNGGTGFENDNLENAIQTFPATNVEYVDRGHPIASEDGSVFRPWNTVEEGISAATTGATVSIVKGTYNNESLTITKPVTLRAPVGVVTIGSP